MHLPEKSILVVDDELQILNSVELILNSAGMADVITCSDSRKVLDILQKNEIEIILLDLMMPHVSGIELLPEIIERYPEIPVIINSGVNEVETAISCIRLGAYDYLVKPVSANQLKITVTRAIERNAILRENRQLKKSIIEANPQDEAAFSRIVTKNGEMFALFRYVRAIARSDYPVLLQGESGVGKDLFAEAIHLASGRAGEFVTVNIAGLDDNIFSDTLFGHTKGAFTGAQTSRGGLIEKAENGTLFLDEIGDLSTASQVKLLRLIDSGDYFPIGSDEPRYSRTRIIVATHRNLVKLKSEGIFRNDLYYRLNSHHIDIPPLRNRKEDIPLLFNHFLEEAATQLGRQVPSYHPELITAISTYHYPGNVRELRAMIIDAIANHQGGLLSSRLFSDKVMPLKDDQHTQASESRNAFEEFLSGCDRLPTLNEAPDALIDEALKRSNNNQRVAAALLGITPQALSQRLAKRRSH